ncbi:uncharacterized [Tachysurus ichikawai]
MRSIILILSKEVVRLCSGCTSVYLKESNAVTMATEERRRSLSRLLSDSPSSTPLVKKKLLLFFEQDESLIMKEMQPGPP